MAEDGYINGKAFDKGSDNDKAKASAVRRTYIASATSDNNKAVATAVRRACTAMAARRLDGGPLRQQRPSGPEAAAFAARRTCTTKAT